MWVNRKKGFTLIELLVVIAIIAILAAILFPVFARAKERARSAVCQSNLKGIGNAILIYLSDYDDWYPRSCWSGKNKVCGSWRSLFYRRMWQYMRSGKLLICPSDPYRAIKSQLLAVFDQQKLSCWSDPARTIQTTTGCFTSYGLNQPLFTKNQKEIIRSAEMKGRTLADQAIMADACVWWVGGVSQSQTQVGPTLYGAGSLCHRLRTEHNNGGNILFADGHVKWLGKEKMTGGGFGEIQDLWSLEWCAAGMTGGCPGPCECVCGSPSPQNLYPPSFPAAP